MDKNILLLSIILLGVPSGFAHAYQFELNGSYISGDLYDIDYDSMILGGTAYFSDVDTSHGPLAEASFLDHSSSASLVLIQSEDDTPNNEKTNDELLLSRIVFADQFILELGYADIDYVSFTDSLLIAGAGMYITTNVDLVLSYATYDDLDTDYINLNLHGVVDLYEGASLAWNAGITSIDFTDGDATITSVEATYYPTASVGIGIDYTLTSSDESDETTLSVLAHYFFTPTLGISVFASAEGQDAEGNSMGLGGTFRF